MCIYLQQMSIFQRVWCLWNKKVSRIEQKHHAVKKGQFESSDKQNLWDLAIIMNKIGDKGGG